MLAPLRLASADPPLPPAPIGSEIGGGVAGLFVGAFAGLSVGAGVGYGLDRATGNTDNRFAGGGSRIGLVVGSVAGTGVGVWAAGRDAAATGSLPATTGGALVGTVVSVIAADEVGRGLGHDRCSGGACTAGVYAVAAAIVLGGPIAGAALGFHVTRHARLAPVIVPADRGVVVSLATGTF